MYTIYIQICIMSYIYIYICVYICIYVQKRASCRSCRPQNSSKLDRAAMKFTLLLQTRPVPRTRSAAIILRGEPHEPPIRWDEYITIGEPIGKWENP